MEGGSRIAPALYHKQPGGKHRRQLFLGKIKHGTFSLAGRNVLYHEKPSITQLLPKYKIFLPGFVLLGFCRASSIAGFSHCHLSSGAPVTDSQVPPTRLRAWVHSPTRGE